MAKIGDEQKSRITAELKPFSKETGAALFSYFETADTQYLDKFLLGVFDFYIPANVPRPLANISDDANLIDDIGFDSLGIAELVFQMEDLFDITISEEEMVDIISYKKLKLYLHQKLQAEFLSGSE